MSCIILHFVTCINFFRSMLFNISTRYTTSFYYFYQHFLPSPIIITRDILNFLVHKLLCTVFFPVSQFLYPQTTRGSSHTIFDTCHFWCPLYHFFIPWNTFFRQHNFWPICHKLLRLSTYVFNLTLPPIYFPSIFCVLTTFDAPVPLFWLLLAPNPAAGNV